MIDSMSRLLGYAALAVLLACSQNQSSKRVDEALQERGLSRVEGVASPPGQGKEAERLATPAYGEGEAELNLPGLQAQVPAGWEQRPPSSSMRVAEFVMRSKSDGEEASLAIFKGPMGSVDANIDRWTGQFDDVDDSQRWEVSVDGGRVQVTMLDVAGIFTGSMGGGSGPQPGYRLLGAIVGEGSYYLKLLGPGATVVEWKVSFEDFVGSISTN